MHDLAQNIMDNLIPFFDLFILALNIFSIVVLIWGVIMAGIDFLKSERTDRNRVVMARQNNFIKSFRELHFTQFRNTNCSRYY